MTSESSRDDRLLDLARRLLAGDAIDWEKEGIAESEVREGMKRLQKVVPRQNSVRLEITGLPVARSYRDR